MKVRVLGAVAALLLVTNLLTGWLLISARRESREADRNDASMAVGALLDAAWAIEPITDPADVETKDRGLRAYKALQTAYDSLYALESRNKLSAYGPRWAEVTNTLQGPLGAMILTGDYRELPTVKRRLVGIAGLMPTTGANALASLQQGQSRLSEVTQP